MRFILLAFALVAGATAIHQHEKEAVNVDVLTKQRDIILLLAQLPQKTLDDSLCKLGHEYKVLENIRQYNDQNTVKYLVQLVKIGRIQPKGVPFTTSHTELRKEVALLTRTFLAAKDYETFLKTAAWARLIFNEDQFYKAFVAACLQREDTKGVIFPAPYEVFPYYYFDTRVIKKAQDMRIRSFGKTHSGDVITIPSNYTAWLPMAEDHLAYFTQDIGLASWYFYFSLGGWMMPKMGSTTDESNLGDNYVCDHCETGRGALYYYVHQQIVARYNLERMSMGLGPIAEVDYMRTHTPYKPHLSYMNGLEFPGRNIEYNMLVEKKHLIRTVKILEARLKRAIDSGYVTSATGNRLSLYDRKGLDMLGTLIEGCGKSINPRYYGSLQAAARELLGGAPITKHFWEPMPSALEIQHTTTRDPIFFKLWKHITRLFERWQSSLPSYKSQDLIFEGVTIESVKFDDLITYCEEFIADIGSATVLPEGEGGHKNVEIKTVVERLNHKSYNYEIVVNSDKAVKNAVVRVYLGPKFDFNCEYCNIRDHRLDFVEMDQFVCDLKEGKNVIVRNSMDAPMRSIDTLTQKEIYRKVEEALNSHQPFYPWKVAQMFGFPERLALPRGNRNGLPLQVFTIITPFKTDSKSYGPVVPPKWQTYHDTEFPEMIGEMTKKTRGEFFNTDVKYNTEDISGEAGRRTEYTREHSGERSGERSGEDLSHTHTHRGSRFNRHHDRTSDSVDTDTMEHRMVQLKEKNHEFLKNYYKNRPINEVMGGAISLDGRPFGFPLERRLSFGCLNICNVKVVDVKVFSKGHDKCGGFVGY